MTEIQYVNTVKSALRGAGALALIAPKAAFEAGWHRETLGAPWAADLDRAVADAGPGDAGAVIHTYGAAGAPRRIFVAVLPDKVSRHNTPTRAEALRSILGQISAGDAKKVALIVRLDDPAHATAAAATVARSFPLYNRTTGGKKGDLRVALHFNDAEGRAVKAPPAARNTAEAVRLACRLVDLPAEELSAAAFEAEAKAAVKDLDRVKVSVIAGDRLLRSKLGGIHAVGRAAKVPPRLVVLTYTPGRKARRTVALVGKGVVYDTGGLNIKTGGHMATMKCDMGGAAAVLGAFLALARAGGPDRVHALLCLAENAVGPESYRPDDIIAMHSGKTVEIDNTDAEGRLLLADGVSWAARNLKADLVIDAATLTGAALVATGHAVSFAVSNRDGLDACARAAGRASGDLTWPMLFLPEFYRAEFKSRVADMRNSVKDRMNASASCAAQFVYSHIEDVNPAWLHLDIAGPAFRDGRGTGHGVALIAEIVRTATKETLAG